MAENKSWKTLKRDTILSTPFIDVWNDTIELPSGNVVDDYSVVGLADGVLVVATDQQDRLVMFDEYKYAIDKSILTMPAGKIDEGEAPVEAAIRELLEETGYSSDEVEYIAPLYVYPSKIKHTSHVVRVRNAVLRAPKQHEATELIGEIRLIPLDEIKILQAEGALNTTYVLSALALTLPQHLAAP